MIFSMAVFQDQLYAAVTSSTGEAEGVLWRSADGEAWDAVTPDGLLEAASRPYGYGAMAAVEDTLFISSTPHGGSVPHVWMSPDGQRWERLTTDEQFATANAIPTLCGFHGRLYVGTFSFSRGEFATSAGAAIWRFTPPRESASGDPDRF